MRQILQLRREKNILTSQKKYNIQVRCIDIIEAMFRNNKREKVIPKITYYVFRKKYEDPKVTEGFTEVITM